MDLIKKTLYKIYEAMYYFMIHFFLFPLYMCMCSRVNHETWDIQGDGWFTLVQSCLRFHHGDDDRVDELGESSAKWV